MATVIASSGFACSAAGRPSASRGSTAARAAPSLDLGGLVVSFWGKGGEERPFLQLGFFVNGGRGTEDVSGRGTVGSHAFEEDFMRLPC